MSLSLLASRTVIVYLANIEDPDAAFHQCLHCLLGQKYSEKKFYLKMITGDPPKFNISNQKEVSISQGFLKFWNSW